MITDFIPEPVRFEWDKGNLEKNFKKHGVLNEEAESAFFDRGSLLADDLEHSKSEDRFQIIGKSEQGELLNVIFTIRRGKVRIISARKANSKERRLYESQKIKTNT